MHYFIKSFAILVGVVFMSSCLSIKSSKSDDASPDDAKPAAPLKVGLYLDKGSKGNGPFQWARLLAYSPQVELILLDGKAVRDGKLASIQLFLSPGGGGGTQIASLRPEGFMNVKKFVEEGGCYLGVCAGSYNAMKHAGRFGFLPYDYLQGKHGRLADLAVQINEEGAKLLGIKAEQRVVRYNGGNIMTPLEEASGSDAKVLAVFKSSVSSYGKAPHNFLDTPSLVYGHYGKGKVLASSFHPESYESTHDIALGYINALTGVRPIPEYPQKSKHPVRVGFFTLACIGPRATYEMLALDKEKSLDVDVFNLHEISVGSLRHYDVVIMPDGMEDSYKKYLENGFYKEQFVAFLERGGRIIASGNGAKYLPEHKNIKVIPVGEDFVKHAKR